MDSCQWKSCQPHLSFGESVGLVFETLDKLAAPLHLHWVTYFGSSAVDIIGGKQV
jgi:hypothetical protein